jgi:hypothetical protein
MTTYGPEVLSVMVGVDTEEKARQFARVRAMHDYPLRLVGRVLWVSEPQESSDPETKGETVFEVLVEDMGPR